MVLRGMQNQRRGPARCTPFTRRALISQTASCEPPPGSGTPTLLVSLLHRFIIHIRVGPKCLAQAAILPDEERRSACPIASTV